MLKKLLLVFGGLLIVILAFFIFRFFYLKGLLSFNPNFSSPKPSPTLEPEGSPLPSPTDLSPSPTESPLSSSSPAVSPFQRGKMVRIDVDDTGAGMYQLSVKKQTKVTLTLNVMTLNVSYGGLDFKSPVVNTGIILPGQSKTVEFIAEQSFDLIPYYAETGNPAPYKIQILVEE
ncbi:MAG: hypothetical protein AB1721_02415 [Patescibacteria group bacterium]